MQKAGVFESRPSARVCSGLERRGQRAWYQKWPPNQIFGSLGVSRVAIRLQMANEPGLPGGLQENVRVGPIPRAFPGYRVPFLIALVKPGPAFRCRCTRILAIFWANAYHR
uniref:Uncharacterized protein n=1 Tax=Magnetospirillum gryphiswaldense TaxID=55518 RepID=A4U3U2_9PROT|nr:hypothetical protein MGR_0735 [Magnetospirillum gryphiswaldense MSR-1]